MALYRAAVVDGQRLVRMMIGQILTESGRFEVAASLPRAADAVRFFESQTADLLLMEIMTPGHMDGFAAAERIKTTCPSVKILLMTSVPEVSFLSRARAAGAESFWYKEAENVQLREVVERTLRGESVYPDAAPSVRLGNVSGSSFTKRELDVLRGLVGGMSNKEIADTFGISEGTIKMHVVNMLQKTGFRSRLELAVRAAATGFIIVA